MQRQSPPRRLALHGEFLAFQGVFCPHETSFWVPLSPCSMSVSWPVADGAVDGRVWLFCTENNNRRVCSWARVSSWASIAALAATLEDSDHREKSGRSRVARSPVSPGLGHDEDDTEDDTFDTVRPTNCRLCADLLWVEDR